MTDPRRYPQPCDPPAWARGGHAQTLFGHLLPSRAPKLSTDARSERVEIELADGERLVARVLPPEREPSGVRVHLFHGLSGDVDSDYMRRAAERFVRSGHEVWAVNHRGCGEGRGLAGAPYHSGRTDDMQAVLAASRETGADLCHLVVGFSLSGNVALLLASQGLEPLPDGLVAVNPPLDLARTSTDIGRGLCRVYERRFVLRMRRGVRERERAGFGRRPHPIPALASMIDFDDLYTAPCCGFEDAWDYYARCSAGPRLGEVRTPSVVITAGDDPFVHPDGVGRAAPSEQVFVHVEPVGGHMGYLARDGGGCRRWLEPALDWYVAELAG